MFRTISSLSLLLAIWSTSTKAREIQKIFLTDYEEPRQYVHKFEAFVVFPNALSFKNNDNQEAIQSPPIFSYNHKSNFQWYVSFYREATAVKTSVWGSSLLSEKSFNFRANVVPPIGISSVTATVEMSIVDSNGRKHNTNYWEKLCFPNGETFNNVWMSWSNASKINVFSPNGDLTLHFKANALYKYNEQTEKVQELMTKSHMAQKTIDQLDFLQHQVVKSDVTLKSRRKEMKCHKKVLSSRSSKMKDIFEDAIFNGTLDLGDQINEDDLDVLVHFLYKGQAANLPRSCFRLFPFAIQYLITDLIEACEQSLVNQINADNCAELYWYGKNYGALQLQKAAAAKISLI